MPDNTAPDGAAAPSAEVSRAAGATSDALAAAAPAVAQVRAFCCVPFSPSSWDGRTLHQRGDNSQPFFVNPGTLGITGL